MKDNDILLRITHRKGFRSSLKGFIFLAICLLLAAFFASGILTFLPPYLHGVLGEGFNIIGWIALWHPVEAFLYDGIPIRNQNKIYQQMREMKIVVRPQ